MASARALVVAVALFATQAGCSATGGVVPVSDFQHDFDVRSRGLQEAESAKNLGQIMPYWAPDAVVHVTGAPVIQGTTAIRAAYTGLLTSLASLRAERTGVTIARSGDLAYETGTNYTTTNTPSGPVSSTSKYLIVWTRPSGGQWQVQAISVTNNP